MGIPAGSSPPMAEPPEARSVRSVLRIARIVAGLLSLLFVLAGLAYAALVVYAFSVCGTVAGYPCGGYLAYALFFPVLLLVWGVVNFVIFVQCREIEAEVHQRQFEPAQSRTLIWMVVGFVLGGVLIAIVLLVAYLKFDPLLRWQRSAGGPPGPVGSGGPLAPPSAAGPSPSPVPDSAAVAPPPPPPAPGPPPNCPTCGNPTTFIVQYGRYYCYPCARYV